MLHRVACPSPNYSSRAGTSVSTIVVHTAQGALTYQSLGNFFASPAAGVSSHVGIDDTPGTVGEYVRRDGKAWTAADANPYSVQAELCAFAEWDSAEWDRHPAMLENCAAWIAEEAAAFGIPLDLLDPGAAQSRVPGVCEHADLGSMGGGHWDCGPSFPIGRVLDMARGAAPEPEGEDDMRMYLAVGDGPGDGRWWLTDLMTKRYCPSLDHAVDTDWWLTQPGLGDGRPLVANRDASGAVAGPISIRQNYIDAVPELR